ncbi:TRAG family protein (plasmid) [Thalassoporum mexicanum PCC 7367]|uniref:type IV secretory system conjugative DNA transfer family protein n=1 Tax=Thalassoporum mexicanum TaxID=3457544 RepID=UPI00029F8CDA|nr:type IV secretion system DNA-binding domain-containing protein [Pseudanabaena sp. PCC 7367]AFY72005.1 TRAG family protein [Pseudanabaena sp. PCC 7367]
MPAPMHRGYVPPHFFSDLFSKTAIGFITIIWLILIVFLVKPTDLDDGLHVFFSVVKILLALVVGVLLCFCSIRLYKDVTEERTFIRPLKFLGFYCITLILLGISLLLSIILFLLISIPLIASIERIRGVVRRRFRIWRGEAYRFIKPYATVLRVYETIVKKLKKKRPDLMTVNWGGLPVPSTRIPYNFFLLGSIGSGKTITMRFFLQDYLPHVGTGKGLRAIIYDAKRDTLNLLQSINPYSQFWIFNPFDQRAFAWDIAKDITQPSHCRALGDCLTLDSNPNNVREEFWRHACVYMLEGLALYFTIKAPGQWGLRDILLGTRSKDRLLKIFNSIPETKRFTSPLEGDRLTHSVMVTIQTYLSPFAVVAALWENSPKKISLYEILEQEGVMILGRDPENMSVLGALARLIVTRMQQIILRRPDTDIQDVNTLFVMDEFQTLGFLPLHNEFSTNARSKGGAQIIATQSLPSVENVYGGQQTREILSQFYHRGYLKMNDLDSARYCSESLGMGERFRINIERTWFGERWKESEYLERVHIVSPEGFNRIPSPDPDTKTGVTGFFHNGDYGYWYTNSSEAISNGLVSKDKSVQNFVPADGSLQYLGSWDKSDLERLGLASIISYEEHQHYLEEEQALSDASISDTEQFRQRLKELLESNRLAYERADDGVDSDTNDDNQDRNDDSYSFDLT